MATELKLPSLGENIESGDIVGVLVSVGDRIEPHQPVLELETDKAVVEVPSSVSGTVREIHVGEGQKATVGQVILTVELTRAGPVAAEVKAAPAAQEEAPEGRVEVASGRPESAEPPDQLVEPPIRQERAEVLDFSRHTAAVSVAGSGHAAIPAAPSVRKLAREIGVDIHQVAGSGPKGRISREDVKRYSRQLHSRTGAPDQPLSVAEELPDFARWGEIKRQPFSNVRRITAERMSRSWLSVPHVTQHDKCDVTGLEERRKRYAGKAEEQGGKLTVTAVALKVAASALRLFPQFNASIDIARQEVVYKEYIHIGVAVDTTRGLLVPVVRDVDRKNILQLSAELREIADRARGGKLGLEEMQGGTFTITNLGGLGGTSFTPLVNWPEVAILGISRSAVEPVWLGGELVPRSMLPLSLSYDHRLIDGALAVRFLRWVAQALEDPFLVSLEG